MLERFAPKFCTFALSALISPQPRLAPKCLALHPHLPLRAQILRLLLQICTSRANLGVPPILRLPPKSCAFQINIAFSQILCFTPKYCALPPNLAPCAQFLRLLVQFLRLAPKFALRAQISAQILRLASKSRTLCPIFAPSSLNLSPRAQTCASCPNIVPCAQMLHRSPNKWVSICRFSIY